MKMSFTGFFCGVLLGGFVAASVQSFSHELDKITIERELEEVRLKQQRLQKQLEEEQEMGAETLRLLKALGGV